MSTAAASASRSQGREFLRRFMRNKLGVIGFLIVLILVVMAIFAPQLAPNDPYAQSLLQRRSPPGGDFLLGADEFGRDILSRIIYGSRATLIVSFSAIALGLIGGVGLGVIAGYFGGWVDTVVMRVMDVLLAFPYLLLAIIVVSALGSGIQNSIIAIAIWATPSFARVTRSAVIGLREREFIDAARAQGSRDLRIMTQHILPNFVSTLLVYGSLNMANAVLMEAALSFLGLGVQPPTASWAAMISNGRDFIVQAPHIATIPGVFIALSVLGFNLLGDALRDALDPKQR